MFHTQRLHQHALRAASQAGSQTFIILAFSMMSLAGAIAINFSAPLFATLVSALVLKEAVGPARWTALMVGFLGVLIVTNPGADTFQMGALFALANAIMYGSVTAGVRGMTATESTETLTMYQMVLITFFFALLLPFGFRVPTWSDGLMLTLNGVTNAFGQYWWTRALHLAPASAVSPFYYLSLVWAMSTRVPRLGRRADRGAPGRLRHCCRLGPVPAVAGNRRAKLVACDWAGSAIV